MQIAILEMPAEKGFRIQLDGAQIKGFFKRDVHKEGTRYLVYPGTEKKPLRTEPHSREGAAMLLLYHHFEQERKRIAEHQAAHGNS